jgi:hypothetical protein
MQFTAIRFKLAISARKEPTLLTSYLRQLLAPFLPQLAPPQPMGESRDAHEPRIWNRFAGCSADRWNSAALRGATADQERAGKSFPECEQGITITSQRLRDLTKG